MHACVRNVYPNHELWLSSARLLAQAESTNRQFKLHYDEDVGKEMETKLKEISSGERLIESKLSNPE